MDKGSTEERWLSCYRSETSEGEYAQPILVSKDYIDSAGGGRRIPAGSAHPRRLSRIDPEG